MKVTIKQKALDKLIDEWKERGQENENLRTQVRNLENCIASIIEDHGHNGALKIYERTLKGFGGATFALTWDRVTLNGRNAYEMQLCREHGDS